MGTRKLTYIELFGGLQGVVKQIMEDTPNTIQPGQGIEPTDPVVQDLENILKECKEGVREDKIMNGGLYDGDKERNLGESKPEEDSSFRKELASLINKHSLESGSDTPDFILADYLTGCLKVFDEAMAWRKQWYSSQEELRLNLSIAQEGEK